jgi:sulfoxide reductase catalytic subunit YedY
MTNVIIHPAWALKEREATDALAYQNRRAFLSRFGLGSIGILVAPSLGCSDGRASQVGEGAADGPLDTIPKNAPRDGYPAARNSNYAVPERPITDRISASSYTNFYEFDGTSKEVWQLTSAYEPYPWTLEVDGLVEKPFTVDLTALIRRLGIEERVYRFRCVEAWSATIPWSGFPLRKLIELCKPLSKATHVRFVSAARKDQMPGIKNQPWYPWPYFEGLRMDEATNDLAFVATGMFGEPLTKQNGSPLRLALPWKYGYKGSKAIVRIEFVDREPPTFWNNIAPDEYSFLSNVNPNVPHPRWSQATERFIRDLDNIERIPTQLFNGYEEFVGSIYPREPRG